MRSNYPYNCWYVAAASDELGHGLLARRLLDKPVVLYRRDSGEVVAMEDRCIHRAYPLSEGRRDGDRVICGYHGFAYDPDGCLVDVPSQENVPPGARVRTYPVYEQSPFVWIWLGDPGVARAVVGVGLYLTALAVLAVTTGTLLRHSAAAITCIVAVLFVLPGIAQALPGSWRRPVTEFWPTQAGTQILTVHRSAYTLQPWPGFGVMCLFVAIVYAIAWMELDRRDA